MNMENSTNTPYGDLYDEYDPTSSEHPSTAKEYNSIRPHSRRRMWDLNLGTMFQVWPDFPEQIVRYGKYHLRWEYKTQPGFGHYYRNRKISVPQISVDGKTWLEFDEVAMDPYYARNQKKTIPAWFNKQELLDEVETKYKEFTRKRNRMLAKRRREKLKKEAEEAGMSFADYKAMRSKQKKKERKERKRIKTGEKLADALNRKIQLAMVLKDLQDELTSARTNLEDETKNLDLTYINNKIDKLKTAILTLRDINRERKK